MDYAALKTYIETDPDGLGFAAHFTPGNDAHGNAQPPDTPAMAALLSADSAVEAYVGLIDVGAFMILFADAFEAVSALSAGAIKDKWMDRERRLYAAGSFDTTSPVNQMMLADLVVDGLIADQATVDARVKRKLTWAEKLLGQGTVVTYMEVAKALWG